MSPRPAPCADRPDRDQGLVLDDMIMVVEIHRRIAVRHGERDRIAGRKRFADAGCDQRGMFIAHEGEKSGFRRAAPNDRDAAVGKAFDMLLRPAVILHAAAVQIREDRDRPGERNRRFGRGDAGACDARVDVDDDIEAGFERHIESSGNGGMVDDRHQALGRPRERRQPFDRARRSNRRGDQDAGDAAVGQHLGFADLGAADPGSARGELAPDDIDALVGLGVRAQADTMR